MKSFLLALFLVLASFGVQAGEPTNLQQRILDYYRKVPQERLFLPLGEFPRGTAL